MLYWNSWPSTSLVPSLVSALIQPTSESPGSVVRGRLSLGSMVLLQASVGSSSHIPCPDCFCEKRAVGRAVVRNMDRADVALLAFRSVNELSIGRDGLLQVDRAALCCQVVCVVRFGETGEGHRTRASLLPVIRRLPVVQSARVHRCAAAAAPDHQACHLHCRCPCDHLDLPAARGADGSRCPPDPSGVRHQRGRTGPREHVLCCRAGGGGTDGRAGPS